MSPQCYSKCRHKRAGAMLWKKRETGNATFRGAFTGRLLAFRVAFAQNKCVCLHFLEFKSP